MLSPTEITKYCSQVGNVKAERRLPTTLMLSVAAGAVVALTGAATNTLSHGAINDPVAAKLVAGIFFPFALVMVILLGFELFTGNCLMAVGVLNRDVKISKMLKNLIIVYLGNFAGGFLVALGCFVSGQFDMNKGLLGVYTIKVAAAKCVLPFGNALILGIFCNVLVCAALLLAYSSKDTTGRIIGAYGPVALFVFAGFEHSVANMYYISAGLFAKTNVAYATIAGEMGIDVSSLSIGGFLIDNLVPVTLGNLLGGLAISICMWFAHVRSARTGQR